MDYNETTNRLSLDIKNGGKLLLGNGLQFAQGFENSLYASGKFDGEYTPRLSKGIFSLFIYINIVCETLVGDSYVPLLRSIHIPTAEYGTTVHQNIENPIYIKLNRNEIKDIEVQICDDSGVLVPFQEGKCLLMLHFKKL